MHANSLPRLSAPTRYSRFNTTYFRVERDKGEYIVVVERKEGRKGRESEGEGIMRVNYIGEGEGGGIWFDLLLVLSFFLSFFFACSSLSRRLP